VLRTVLGAERLKRAQEGAVRANLKQLVAKQLVASVGGAIRGSSPRS
jgi:hypothetical protein